MTTNTAPTSAPYLSLGMMLGDAHVGVLERCLRSVLVRSVGEPLVDEIVIGWNGTQHKALTDVLVRLEYQHEANSPQWGHLRYPPVKVVLFKWPGRFDTARNIYWKHLTGEWLLWLDGDDEVMDAGTPEGLRAIEQVERDYGLPPMPAGSNVPTTLKTWLAALPPRVNCVYCPYDYTTDENGYVQVRQKMKRLVRRAAGHVWTSPEQSGIHELLTCIGGQAEVMAETFGFLVKHYPSEAEVQRVQRNRAIVVQLTKPGTLSDPRHAYDVANAALTAGNLAQANEAISQAIVHAHNDMDRYTYRLARAFIGMAEGNAEKMLQEAFAAVGIMPEIRDAYFVACDAFFRLGKWLAVIEWFERGVAKTPTLLSRDQPLAVFIAPRGQAALAYAYIGLTEKALALVVEMEKEYPKAGLTVEVGQKVRAMALQQGGEVALYNALDYALAISPTVAWKMVQALRSVHALDVLRSTVTWGALEHRIEDAAANTGFRIEDGVATFCDRGIITVDDVLDHARAARPQLQLLSAEVAADRRSAKVAVRPTHPFARRIAFYAPTGIYRWECSEYGKLGMGGSESSVALLARELAQRGHDVTTFTNKRSVPMTSVWDGVVEKDCSQYRPAEWDGDSVVVFCRAPWMVREDPPKTKNIWCWHQDNGYGNAWMWNQETLLKQGHLFVSLYALGSLLRDAGVSPDAGSLPVRHAVLGNGILAECSAPVEAPRRRHSVVYASNPSRGLGPLLQAWSLVLREVPDAHLTVMCEWNVMLATGQSEPGLSLLETTQKLQVQLNETPGASNLGWLPQDRVLKELRKAEIYCYPGGPMPEGFGVALVQAQAAGCRVLAPREGALPEVLDEKTTSWLASKGPAAIAAEILRAFSASAPPPVDMTRHHWDSVADRFLRAVVGTR